VARLDRVARWIAADILRERGVEKTPASMSAVMPVSYVFAEGVMRALGEMATEMAAELAGATAVIRVPVPAGAWFAGEDLAAWEAELSRDGPETDGGL